MMMAILIWRFDGLVLATSGADFAAEDGSRASPDIEDLRRVRYYIDD